MLAPALLAVNVLRRRPRSRLSRPPFRFNRDMALDPIAAWPLFDGLLANDVTAGDLVGHDYAGGGNHAFAAQTNAASRTSTIFGGSVPDLDGDWHIQCGTDAALEVQEHSFSVWFRPTSFPNPTIIGGKSDSILASGLEWGCTASDLRLAYFDTALRGWYILSTTLVAGNIYHLLFTWTPGTFEPYLDGVSLTSMGTTSGTINYNNDTFDIGHAHDFPGNPRAEGQFWDARLFDRRLDAKDALHLYDPATRNPYEEISPRTYIFPGVTGSITVSPTAASAKGAVVAPTTVLGSLTIPPAAAIAATAKVDPGVVLGSLLLEPSGAIAKTATLGPTVVLGSLLLEPTAASAVAAVVDPDVVGGGSQTVTPLAASAQTEAPAPTIVLGSITLDPDAAIAVASVVAPTVLEGAITIEPSPAAAAAGVVAPTVIQGSILAIPPSADARAQVAAPTVIGGGVLVSPAAAIARALAVDPTVKIVANVLAPVERRVRVPPQNRTVRVPKDERTH